MADPTGFESESALPASPDHARPEIERVPWLAVVRVGADSSALLGRLFSLSESPFVIGRGSASNLICVADRASRHHASIACDERGWRIWDAGSTNGTFVNGKRVDEALLVSGDRIQIGDVVIKFIGAEDLEAKYRARTALVEDGSLVEEVVAVDPFEIEATGLMRDPIKIDDVVFKFAVARDIAAPETFEEYLEATRSARRADARKTVPPEPPSQKTTDAEVHASAKPGKDSSESSGDQAARRIDYAGADLRKADFSFQNLAGANFDGADLSGAVLKKANLTGATLNGAKIVGADFTDANLEHAQMRGAECAVVILRGANLRHADLSHARLELTREPMPIRSDSNRDEVEMQGVMVTRADLCDANLEGADLHDANLGGARLTRANLRRANLARTQLRNAELFGANLRDANLKDATARGATFDGAWLVGANLEGADLRGATFRTAWLACASLVGAKASKADFRDARFSSSATSNGQHSLQFSEARLYTARPAWALDRIFGTRYKWQAMASASVPVVVLRYVGGLSGVNDGRWTRRWSSDPRKGLELSSFAEWLERWSELLGAMNFDPGRRFGSPVAQILSIEGFDQLRAEHAPVISIAADLATAVILAAILKVAPRTELTDQALSTGAEEVRASVVNSLAEEARHASHLNDVAASGFFASCIRFVVESSSRGCDVLLID